MRDFKKLQVWQKSHRLTLEIYQATKTFPREELYGLTGQIRRAASSVPANLAEGCGRSTETELARFCDIASGSSSETVYHLLLAHDLGYLSKEQFTTLDAKANEVKRMLNSFTQAVRRSIANNR